MKQQKSKKAFRQAVNEVLTDNTHETELLKQRKTIENCKNKLAACGMLLYYFSCCGCDKEESEAKASLAKAISEKLFVVKSSEEEFWRLSAKDLFESILILLGQSREKGNPAKEFYNILAITPDIQKLCNKLEHFSQSDKGQQYSKNIQRFLNSSDLTKAGIIAHMNTQLLGFMRFDLV